MRKKRKPGSELQWKIQQQLRYGKGKRKKNNEKKIWIRFRAAKST